MYLARIEAYDKKGPKLNAMVALNPNALARAQALDAERQRKGPRGPLHGIPIVVKDNYDTKDMPTTGGSLALAGWTPPDDAHQVEKLREAGAIIIGKTNLHELAAGITTVGSLVGQTRNPYDPRRNPGGSSGGTGAAVAASFAVAGMGSDTCGSIRIPSSHNNLVGLRGTAGLSSRDGIIPLSHTQDIGGPLARSVTDLAILLDATVGPDPADPVTERSRGRVPKTYRDYLDPNGLKGARLAVLEEAFGDGREDEAVKEIVMAAVEKMREQGAEIIEMKELHLEELLEDAGVITHEFKFDLMDYLQATPDAPVASLEEILEKGLNHVALQSRFEARNEPKSRETEEYKSALAKQDTLRRELLRAMKEMDLTAFVYPTIRRKPALIGEPQIGSNCLISAGSGFPAISVPAGFTSDGLPVGVELLGKPFAEPDLVKLAYAFEQANRHRRPPPTTPALVNGKVPKVTFGIHAVREDYLVLGRLTYDPSTRELSHIMVASEMDAEDLQIRLHRGVKGENGPVLHLLEGLVGTVVLSETERCDLMGGRVYVAFYRRFHPEVIIRSQVEIKHSADSSQ
jgi:Asp-tRNA(Asn)/Glu-tRNA(Gln) amidotransferase A subunit family amidase